MLTDRNLLHTLNRWFPLALFLGGIVFFCLRVTGFDLAYLPGDEGDSRFINFLLEHGFQWLSGNTNGFWNADFMYPFQDNIAFSDNMLGSMPIYAFFRMFGLQPETAFQMWWISVCSLNFWSAYFVLKKWLNRSNLAAIGALIFAFSIFQQGQMNYMQMSVRFAIPVVIYAAIQLVKTGQPKYLAYYAFALVVQFYCALYTGIFLFYFSAGLILIYALFTRRHLFFVELFRRESIGKSLAIGLTSGVLLFWILWPYLKMAMYAGTPGYEESVSLIPTLSSYLHAHDSSWILGSYAASYKDMEAYWLHYNFPGFILILSFLATPIVLGLHWFKKRSFSKELLALSVVILLVFLFFLRTENGLSLYRLIAWLPGLSSVRVLNRFMHVEIFLLILVLLYLWKKLPKRYVWVLLALCILDNGFSSDKTLRTNKSRIVEGRTELTQKIAKKRNGSHKAFVVLRSDRHVAYTQVEAMMVSQLTGLPTVNGYSSSCPGAYGEFFLHCNEEGLNIWLDHNRIDPAKILVIRMP